MTIIAITGFMAAGKTTVARELGRHLNYPVLDLDDLIIERERCSIRELIEQLGEPEFRNVETDVLRQFFVDNSSAVIALGGGAWTIERNRELIADHGAISVWIDAPFEVCWSRIEETMQAAAEACYLKARPLDNTDFVMNWRKQMARRYTYRALEELCLVK